MGNGDDNSGCEIGNLGNGDDKSGCERVNLGYGGDVSGCEGVHLGSGGDVCNVPLPPRIKYGASAIPNMRLAISEYSVSHFRIYLWPFPNMPLAIS